MQLYFSKFDYNLALIRLFLLINRNFLKIYNFTEFYKYI